MLSDKILKLNIVSYLAIFIFFCLISLLSESLLAKNDKTTVVIIGTVHNPTNNFNEKILSNIFLRINPDVILNELDSSFFDTTNSIKKEYIDISVENKTVSN
jgi:hypothetical protein